LPPSHEPTVSRPSVILIASTIEVTAYTKSS
jgi:hypothetical protein